MSDTNHVRGAEAVKVGRIAPDFTLEDVNGESHTLSTAVEKQPIILVFYRGDWCPYCQMQMYQLGQVADKLALKGAKVWAVSPQKHERNAEFARKREVPFPILWDENLDVINAWGLLDELDPHQESIPYPTTYIIGPDNLVLWRKLGQDKVDRPTPDQVMSALEETKP